MDCNRGHPLHEIAAADRFTCFFVYFFVFVCLFDCFVLPCPTAVFLLCAPLCSCVLYHLYVCACSCVLYHFHVERSSVCEFVCVDM